MKIRDPKFDKHKSKQELRLILAEKKKCEIPGCDNLITDREGPGSDSLCRQHQVEQREYGGYGRLDRLHTFHRNDVCECCGQDINDDPRRKKAEEYFGVELTPEQWNAVKRRYNHGDHDTRRVDEGEDTKENINSFCTFCHWIKTEIKGDSLVSR